MPRSPSNRGCACALLCPNSRLTAIAQPHMRVTGNKGTQGHGHNMEGGPGPPDPLAPAPVLVLALPAVRPAPPHQRDHPGVSALLPAGWHVLMASEPRRCPVCGGEVRPPRLYFDRLECVETWIRRAREEPLGSAGAPVKAGRRL